MRTHIVAAWTLTQPNAAAALLATISVRLVGYAARRQRLASAQAARRGLDVRDVLVAIVRAATGLELNIPLRDGAEAAGADRRATVVTVLVDRVGEGFGVSTLQVVSE